MPAEQAAAQDSTLGGAIFGGAAGAIIGGALGGGRGAAAGAIIGGATGAMIGSQGEARGRGYYYYNNGCYIQRPDGAWIAVSPAYCNAPPPAYVPPPQPVYGGGPPPDAVAYCQQRFRSYDPVSGTYLGFDGLRHPCP
jgi:hypothetical protein